MELVRAHGLGNDYLVLQSKDTLNPRIVQALCDRHFGVGGDGVLQPVACVQADYGVTIWNPDGTIAEKSGNGLRIFAQWLFDQGAPETFSIWTGSDRVICRVQPGLIHVEMGTARFDHPSVPTSGKEPLSFQHGETQAIAVGMGNPHCVLFFNQALDSLSWREWGAEIETHPRFPNHTNVQFARIIDEHTVEIRIWERGAGETTASGSSSCAVAAAGVHTGRLKRGIVTVKMPGGALTVAVGPQNEITLSGPVQMVGTIQVDPRWLKNAQH